MKKSIIGFIAAILGASSAYAADIEAPSLKDEPNGVAVDSRWGGLYVGGQAGLAIGKSTDRNLDLPVPVLTLSSGETIHTHSTTASGAAYGGYFGYNWQSGPLVYGVEASFNGANLSGTWTLLQTPIIAAVPFDTEYDVTHDLNWFASATGRLGYAQGRLLFYGLGGFVWGNDETTLAASFFDLTSSTQKDSASRVGWTAGLGIEYAVNDRFSTRIEYSHADFGGKEYFGGGDHVDITLDTIKLGASYKLSNDGVMTPLQ